MSRLDNLISTDYGTTVLSPHHLTTCARYKGEIHSPPTVSLTWEEASERLRLWRKDTDAIGASLRDTGIQEFIESEKMGIQVQPGYGTYLLLYMYVLSKTSNFNKNNKSIKGQFFSCYYF